MLNSIHLHHANRLQRQRFSVCFTWLRVKRPEFNKPHSYRVNRSPIRSNSVSVMPQIHILPLTHQFFPTFPLKTPSHERSIISYGSTVCASPILNPCKFAFFLHDRSLYCTFYVYNTLIHAYAHTYTYSPQSKMHIPESYIMFLYPVVFHIYSTIPSPAEEPRINPSYILRTKTAMEA